ncbi:MAG: DNA-binding response regulator [Pirellulaceae bacterium]|nr:MAG: DNA-binding response regulator [Pirellulaceae bacterium]
MAQQVLIVEDDISLADMVARFLREHGFWASIVSSGASAVERLTREAFDAVILDIGLPDFSGIEVCERVRASFDGPIIILTARGDEIDEVVALEVGADDYMAKPVRPRALLMRLKVHLRRAGQSESVQECRASVPLAIGNLAIDPATREVTLDGKSVSLTTAEFDLLYLLATRAGTVVSRAELYERLNGIPFESMDRSIDLRVSRLRRKLGDDSQAPSLIKSVRGVGYLLAVRR